jgi:hypothetical protein
VVEIVPLIDAKDLPVPPGTPGKVTSQAAGALCETLVDKPLKPLSWSIHVVLVTTSAVNKKGESNANVTKILSFTVRLLEFSRVRDSPVLIIAVAHWDFNTNRLRGFRVYFK